MTFRFRRSIQIPAKVPLPSTSASGRLWIALLAAAIAVALFSVPRTTDAETMGWTPSELASAGKAYIEWDHYPAGSEEHRRADAFYWFVIGSLTTLSWQRQICTGPIQGAQVATMVAKYLNDHPETWQSPPASLVLSALQPSFPCPKLPAKELK